MDINGYPLAHAPTAAPTWAGRVLPMVMAILRIALA